MPWGKGPGELPPLRVVNGTTLVQLARTARVHHLVGADELTEDEATREAWHDFADLMRDVADSAAELGQEDLTALAGQVDSLIAALRGVGARVVAGAAGIILYVAVLPRGYRRDARLLFARS
jgi:proline dehydrogenase